MQAADELFAQGQACCKECSEVKALDQFGRNSRSRLGVMPKCKPCTNRQMKTYSDKAKAQDYEGFQTSRRKLRRDWAARQKQQDPEKYTARLREEGLKHRYGITLHQFNIMLAEQDGRCAICMAVNPKEWHVDHDHECCPGRKSCGNCLRGVLCEACNIALGGFKDNRQTLIQAELYLRKAA